MAVMGKPFTSACVLIRLRAKISFVTLSSPANTLPYVPCPTCLRRSKALTSRRTTGARIEVVRDRLTGGTSGEVVVVVATKARLVVGVGAVLGGGGALGGGGERFGGGGGALGGGGFVFGAPRGGGGGVGLGPPGVRTMVEALAIWFIEIGCAEAAGSFDGREILQMKYIDTRENQSSKRSSNSPNINQKGNK